MLHVPQDTDSFAKLQQSVAAILARAVKRVDGKVASFSKDLAAAAGSEGTARRAELIMANLHRHVRSVPMRTTDGSCARLHTSMTMPRKRKSLVTAATSTSGTNQDLAASLSAV